MSKKVSIKRSALASSLMILTMICLRYMSHGESILPEKPFSTFPTQIGEWIGKEKRFDESIYDILGVDDSFLGNYVNSDGSLIQLYVGFYRSQRQGNLIHSPKNCMPAAGWNTVKTTIQELIPGNYNSEKIKMVRLILEKDTQRQIVMYWFQSRGRFIASEYMQKVYLVIDSITRHRTDGAFVRLSAPVMNGDEEKASKDIRNFVELLLPILQEYLPS